MIGTHNRCRREPSSRLSGAALFCVLACCSEAGPRGDGHSSSGLSTASGARARVVFLGDSLTAGYGIDPDDSFPAVVQQKIDDRGWPFEAVNAGVSGETSSGGLRRLEWVLRDPPAVLVIALGGNDALRGIDPAVLERNLARMIDRARETAPGVRVVLAGMLAPPNLGLDYCRRFADAYKSVARAKDVARIPFLLEDVAAEPGLNLPDGLHPNARGQRIIAENVWKILKPILADLAAS